MEADREFDIIVYGATGFVGKLTAQYLAKAGAGARIALAGRSTERLEAARAGAGPEAVDWALITADATKPATLEEMAARTRVVVTTVGPYSKYGMPVVAACAAAGTDYADLTGEANFIRASIDEHHKQAVETGARIVHACGFDSIPSDLTVFALYRRAAEDAAGTLGDTTMVVRTFAGGVSGGTMASMIEVLRASADDADMRRTLNDPYTLSPERDAEPDLGRQSDMAWRRGADIAPELAGIWTSGFVMGIVNTRIVRRSNALLDWAYGRNLRYTEAMSMGSSVVAPVASLMATGGQAGVAGLGPRLLKIVPERFVERITPAPGSGPSEQTRERGHYRVETYTTTKTGARYVCTMAQRGDPGYKATAVLLGESALALALDRDALSPLRGVLTPAAAMGDALLTRLPRAGVTLDTAKLA